MELRTYEGMFMLDPTKANQEWDIIKKQISSMIERRSGVIINARKWGERKLAYEIQGHKRAAYLLIYFQMPPENLNILRRDIQLSELVMRTLILVHMKPSKEEQQKILEVKEDEEIAKEQEIDSETPENTWEDEEKDDEEDN